MHAVCGEGCVRVGLWQAAECQLTACSLQLVASVSPCHPRPLCPHTALAHHPPAHPLPTTHPLLQNKGGEFSAPLTSFDWNELDPRRIGTASIDTTCTIWDIERGLVDTQLIAHDKEVRVCAWAGWCGGLRGRMERGSTAEEGESGG